MELRIKETLSLLTLALPGRDSEYEVCLFGLKPKFGLIESRLFPVQVQRRK